MAYFVQSTWMVNGRACESAKTKEDRQRVLEISEASEMQGSTVLINSQQYFKA